MVISLSLSSRYIYPFHLRRKGNQTHQWDLNISGFTCRTRYSDMSGTGDRKKKLLKPRKEELEKCQSMNQIYNFSSIKHLLCIRDKFTQQQL